MINIDYFVPDCTWKNWKSKSNDLKLKTKQATSSCCHISTSFSGCEFLSLLCFYCGPASFSGVSESILLWWKMLLNALSLQEGISMDIFSMCSLYQCVSVRVPFHMSPYVLYRSPDKIHALTCTSFYYWNTTRLILELCVLSSGLVKEKDVQGGRRCFSYCVSHIAEWANYKDTDLCSNRRWLTLILNLKQWKVKGMHIWKKDLRR